MTESAARPRILLVEDEFLVRLSLSETLADEGYDVVEAASGEEALAALAALDRLELLMTDIQLAGEADGKAVARAARERHPGLPVIFMTGRPEALGGDAGARESIVSKPYLPSEIAAHVRRVLAG